MDETYNIHSFVIRIIPGGSNLEKGDEYQQPGRVAVRHIQTNQERNFLNWVEAVAFIQTFVVLPGSVAAVPPVQPAES